MKRRHFLYSSLAAPILAGACTPSPSGATELASPFPAEGPVMDYRAALDSWIAQTRTDLFDEFLPFWEEHGIDHELGGFLASLDHDGRVVSSDKNVWFQGRGLWIWSTLFRDFQEPRFETVARQTRDFLLRHCRDEEGNWANLVSRQGRILSPYDGVIYGGLFVSEGLLAFAEVFQDEECLEIARQTVTRLIQVYDRPGYWAQEDFPQGRRNQGHWMVLTQVLGPLQELTGDALFRETQDRCFEAVIDTHHNRDLDLTVENIHHDGTMPRDRFSHYIWLGHGIETAWILMAEALRRKDQSTAELLGRRIRRHVEVGWDQVFGGFASGVAPEIPHFDWGNPYGEMAPDLDSLNIGEYYWVKPLWIQSEAMVAAAMLMEQERDPWAWKWFDRIHSYYMEKFPLKPHGYKTWIGYGDRRVTYQPNVTRKDNYHPPRTLIWLLRIFERMRAPAAPFSEPVL